jgi:MFS family permease
MIRVLRQRNFALLWSAGFISQAGDWLLLIALPYYIYTLTGSVLATGGMFVAETLPRLVLGSVAGVFADRWDRKRIMIAADLSRAVILLPLLVIHSSAQVPLVYVIAFLESSIGQFFMPADRALLPQLVAQDDLMAANSAFSLSDAVTRLIGPPLGGALLSLLGLSSVVFVDSASYVLSGLFILAVAAPRTATDEVEEAVEESAGLWTEVWRDWIDGLRVVQRSRLLVTVFATWGILMLGQGIVNVLLVAFVRGTMHGSAEVFGWLMAGQGVGALVASLLLAERLGGLAPPTRIVALGISLAGVTLGIATNVPSLGVVLVCLVFIGVLAVAVMISMQTILQTAVPNEYMGRVFGAYGTTAAVTTLVGMAVGSTIGNVAGPVVLLTAAGVLWTLTGLVALPAFARVPQTVLELAVEPSTEPEPVA